MYWQDSLLYCCHRAVTFIFIRILYRSVSHVFKHLLSSNRSSSSSSSSSTIYILLCKLRVYQNFIARTIQSYQIYHILYTTYINHKSIVLVTYEYIMHIELGCMYVLMTGSSIYYQIYSNIFLLYEYLWAACAFCIL